MIENAICLCLVNATGRRAEIVGVQFYVQRNDLVVIKRDYASGREGHAFGDM